MPKMPNCNAVKTVCVSKGARTSPAVIPKTNAANGPKVPPAIIQPSAPKIINAAPGDSIGIPGHDIMDADLI